MKGEPFLEVEQARAMRARGMKLAEIAAHFGRRVSTISSALPMRKRDRTEEYAKRRKGNRPICGAASDGCYVEHHKPRAIRQVIDREAIRQILAERNGSITRETLMARITR